jgi:hypothetical protein
MQASLDVESMLELACRCEANCVPLVERGLAPPQPRGWLTEEERKAVEYFSQFCDEHVVPDQWSVMSARLRNLLARSSPPEVVLPVCPFTPDSTHAMGWYEAIGRVGRLLAAAGVTVKDVE